MHHRDPSRFRDQWAAFVAAGEEGQASGDLADAQAEGVRLVLALRCARHEDRPRLEVREQQITQALFACPADGCTTSVWMSLGPEEE